MTESCVNDFTLQRDEKRNFEIIISDPEEIESKIDENQVNRQVLRVICSSISNACIDKSRIWPDSSFFTISKSEWNLKSIN